MDLLTPLEVASSSTLGITVLRVHLLMQVVNWAQTGDGIMFGLIVGRAADLGTNVAGQVSPFSTEFPWMVWDVMNPDAAGAAVNTVMRYRYDIKAKRKMPELTQRLVLSFLNQSAAAKTININASVLLALP